MKFSNVLFIISAPWPCLLELADTPQGNLPPKSRFFRLTSLLDFNYIIFTSLYAFKNIQGTYSNGGLYNNPLIVNNQKCQKTYFEIYFHVSEKQQLPPTTTSTNLPVFMFINFTFLLIKRDTLSKLLKQILPLRSLNSIPFHILKNLTPEIIASFLWNISLYSHSSAHKIL